MFVVERQFLITFTTSLGVSGNKPGLRLYPPNLISVMTAKGKGSIRQIIIQ